MRATELHRLIMSPRQASPVLPGRHRVGRSPHRRRRHRAPRAPNALVTVTPGASTARTRHPRWRSVPRAASGSGTLPRAPSSGVSTPVRQGPAHRSGPACLPPRSPRPTGHAPARTTLLHTVGMPDYAIPMGEMLFSALYVGLTPSCIRPRFEPRARRHPSHNCSSWAHPSALGSADHPRESPRRPRLGQVARVIRSAFRFRETVAFVATI